MERLHKAKKKEVNLRKKAEKMLLHRKEGDSKKFLADPSKLIYELELHQIELELQNEELTMAKEKSELSEKKYLELYNFAPTAYLTLTKQGVITNLNRSAAHLLEKNIESLVKSSFAFFISPEMRVLRFN